MRTNKVSLLLAMTLIASATSRADCTMPTARLTIPGPTTATRDELTATNAALSEFDRFIGEYLTCIESEYLAAASNSKLTKDQRKELSSAYAAKRDTAIQTVQELAERFNAAVKAFNARVSAK